MTSRAVTLLSGGLDSTTLAYQLKSDGFDVHALSFDYGQRHSKEIGVAINLARGLGVKHHVIELGVGNWDEGSSSGLATVLTGSSLTDESVPVPDGHYAEESMKATVVPNRNAIMLSIAYGVAVAEKAELVAFAAHAGDHAIYPDCRTDFVWALDRALQTGSRWDDGTIVPYLSAPFIGMSKADIAGLANELEVPVELTWSCYKGGDIHCGRCGTCVERKEAFRDAHVTDPTVYEDPAFLIAANVGT